MPLPARQAAPPVERSLRRRPSRAACSSDGSDEDEGHRPLLEQRAAHASARARTRGSRSACPARPRDRRAMRCQTCGSVADDMLPWSCSTSRLAATCASSSSRLSRTPSMIRGPPGCTANDASRARRESRPARAIELDRRSRAARRDALGHVARERHLHAVVATRPTSSTLAESGTTRSCSASSAKRPRRAVVAGIDRVADQAVGEQALHDELLDAVIAGIEVQRAQLGVHDVDAAAIVPCSASSATSPAAMRTRRHRRVAAHVIRVRHARRRAPAARATTSVCAPLGDT